MSAKSRDTEEKKDSPWPTAATVVNQVAGIGIGIGIGSGENIGNGGHPSTSKKGTMKRWSRRRKKKEEEYTDKDRAAAVTLWSRDIKHSLLAQKKRERKMNVETELPQSEEFLSAMFLVEANYQLRVRGQIKAAISCLNKAIELHPSNRKALAIRSECHLKLGDAVTALKDAQTCLDGHETNIMGLYQCAEALYNMGQFENALIAYHRGFRLKKADDFRLGIQKSEEALERAIGDCTVIRLDDLEDILPLLEQEEIIDKEKQENSNPNDGLNDAVVSDGKLKLKKKTLSKNRAKMLAKETLGKMYSDKEYLADLLGHPGIQSDEGISKQIRTTVAESLNYLEIREKFWQQQNPMYARKSSSNLNPTFHRSRNADSTFR